MATHTLGTSATTTLVAVKYTTNLADADIATIDQLIADDFAANPPNLNPSATQTFGCQVLSATSTNGSNALTSVTVSSPSGALLSGLVGGTIYGNNIGIPAGTRVVSVSGTTVTMTANATASAGTGTIFVNSRVLPNCFKRGGQLMIPNRGILQLFPNDAVGVGPAGEIVLVPAWALNYAGSGWSFV